MINQVQAQSPENKMIQFLGNCLKVAIGCLERFIKFLGNMAYIQTAIYGTVCESGKQPCLQPVPACALHLALAPGASVALTCKCKSGHNFCHSIVRAFIRLIKNIIRFSFVTLFAKLVLLMGKLGVTGAGVYVSMLCIAFIYPDPPENALPGAIPIVSRLTAHDARNGMTIRRSHRKR